MHPCISVTLIAMLSLICLLSPCSGTVQANFTIQNMSVTVNTSTIQSSLSSQGFGVLSVQIYALSALSVATQSCPAGAYSLANSQQCTLCPAGKYSTTINAGDPSACTVCPAGTYSNVTGASSIAACTPCAAGMYQESAGASQASACQSCPANSSSYSGNALRVGCVCLPGFSGANGGTCKACNISVWCLYGQANPCPLHSVAPALSYDVAQCLCQPGYYGDTSLGENNTSVYPTLCQVRAIACTISYYHALTMHFPAVLQGGSFLPWWGRESIVRVSRRQVQFAWL